MHIKYPHRKNLSDAEQFCAVFEQLVADKVKSILTTQVGGVVTIEFNDGSKCGGLVPWIKAGFDDLGEVNEYDDFSDDPYNYE